MTKMITAPAMVLLALSARADSVTLKDGETVHGTFIGASGGQVTVQIDGGAKRRFKRDEISSIRFDDDQASSPSSPIEQKYRALGSGAHALGEPMEDERPVDDQRGRFRKYRNGFIYYTPQTGAHSIQGTIAERWLSLGAERSELGYPTADEAIWPDGRHVVSFEHGAIFWDGHDEPVVEIRAH